MPVPRLEKHRAAAYCIAVFNWYTAQRRFSRGKQARPSFSILPKPHTFAHRNSLYAPSPPFILLTTKNNDNENEIDSLFASSQPFCCCCCFFLSLSDLSFGYSQKEQRCWLAGSLICATLWNGVGGLDSPKLQVERKRRNSPNLVSARGGALKRRCHLIWPVA